MDRELVVCSRGSGQLESTGPRHSGRDFLPFESLHFMSLRPLVLTVAFLLGPSSVMWADEPAVANTGDVNGEEKREQQHGWVDLFDGKSLDGWVTENGKPVTKGWKVDEGLLHCPGRVGSIYAAKEYGDFELEFEWKIQKGGNSGIKYRLVHYEKGLFGRPNSLGCEYQIFDDLNRKAAPVNQAAAIYDLIAPNDQKELRPHSEFNHGKIVAHGPKLEHWLNGKLVVEADISSDEWKQQVAQSKFSVVPGFFTKPKGRIQLQDHGNKVWFRTVRIRELPPKE